MAVIRFVLGGLIIGLELLRENILEGPLLLAYLMVPL